MSNLNMTPCSPDEAIDIIRTVMRMPSAVRPAVMLHGEPGCGKSTLTRTVCREVHGNDPIMFHAATHEASDIKGLPDFDRVSDKVRWVKPNFLPTEGGHVLFLDDVTSGRRDVMASLYPIILEKQIDDLKLSDECTIVCAGNDVGDGAIANPMGTALNDRLLQLFVKATPESFVAHWGPKGMSPAILATIQQMPHLFTDNAKRIAEDLAAAPTSRSWERAWHVMEAFDVQKAVKAATEAGDGRRRVSASEAAKRAQRTLEIVLSGCIGTEAAGHLLLTMRDIDECVDPRDILAMSLDEARTRLPKTLRAGVALAFSLATIATTAPEIVKACAIMALVAEARDMGSIPDMGEGLSMGGREIAAFGIERLLTRAETLKVIDAVLADTAAPGRDLMLAYLQDVSDRYGTIDAGSRKAAA